MSELHKFLFDGLPVRGMIVRLTDSWQEMLQRRQSNTATGAYPGPVRALLGEMVAAGALMQSNIKFNGALVLQVFGDGPLKLAVVEVQPDLSLRATASLAGVVADDARLSQMLNQHGRGRCAVTLDPLDRLAGQQPYQGVVPLVDAQGQPLERLSDILQQYMLRSEQLQTTLVLAADDRVAAGLMIQRLPTQGVGNLAAGAAASSDEDFQRVALLAASLQRDELLTLDVDTVLRRLFWQEPLTRYEPLHPRFACNCSRERVGRMVLSLGRDEVEHILAEQGVVEVGCDFCGRQYRFDPVDAAQLLLGAAVAPGAPGVH